MTTQNESFLPVLTALWLRLSTIAIVCLLFFLATELPEFVAGWFFYLTPAEVFYEVAVFAVFLALCGILLGAVCALAVAPILYFRASARARVADAAIRIAVAVTAFLAIGFGLKALANSAHLSSNARDAIRDCYAIAFVAALCFRRPRRKVVTSLDPYLGEKTTRRAVIGTGIAAAALATAEAAMAKAAPAIPPRRAAPPTGPNILLVTFDALSAEDMTVYGYPLPTTPRIQDFARGSSVFTNFYSGSTFTTSSIATMLTGLAPSEHGVYHLEGQFRDAAARKTFPRLLRAGGYFNGASIANPAAYFLAASTMDYDALPDPVYRPGYVMDIWDATRALHRPHPFHGQSEGFWKLDITRIFLGDRLEAQSPRWFGRPRSDSPPGASFDQAREILRQKDGGFFLWVHVFPPHYPYLPSPANLGRFEPSQDARLATQQYFPMHYPPSMQPQCDKLRRRYDEFLADADDAFGKFMSDLENTGALRNTAVIVSADHGETFQGGLFSHGSDIQTRPEIHIPLIIRMPGQQRGARVAVTADETSLAPTILEIAGIPRGDWMRGPSLVPWLNRDTEGEGPSLDSTQGMAFTQFLQKDSTFRPVTHGTVGVIDGRHQYVLDLDTGKGILRPLAEADSATLDRSAENPALAQALRDAIYARFPDLPRKPA